MSRPAPALVAAGGSVLVDAHPPSQYLEDGEVHPGRVNIMLPHSSLVISVHPSEAIELARALKAKAIDARDMPVRQVWKEKRPAGGGR